MGFGNRGTRVSISGQQANKCLGMNDCIYLALRNISWECTHCGMPSFSSALFDLSLFEPSNTFDPIVHDTSHDRDISFRSPQATSSPKTASFHRNPVQHISISSCSATESQSSNVHEVLKHTSFRSCAAQFQAAR